MDGSASKLVPPFRNLAQARIQAASFLLADQRSRPHTVRKTAICRRTGCAFGFFTDYTGAGGLCRAALAADFPARPMEIIVPFPPGGNADSTCAFVGGWNAARVETAGSGAQQAGRGHEYRRAIRRQQQARRSYHAISAPASFVVRINFSIRSLAYDPDTSFSPVFARWHIPMFWRPIRPSA